MSVVIEFFVTFLFFTNFSRVCIGAMNAGIAIDCDYEQIIVKNDKNNNDNKIVFRFKLKRIYFNVKSLLDIIRSIIKETNRD